MVLIKILKPKYWPKELDGLTRATWKINDLRIIPSCDWIINRSKEFGYNESFNNVGMVFPIAVSRSDHSWVEKRVLLKNEKGEYKNPHHLSENNDLIKGWYVHVGNKRVQYGIENNYDCIMGYIITTPLQRERVKKYTHIPHTEIPK